MAENSYRCNGCEGDTGEAGTDGITPYIKNGNWFIGDTDTGIKAHGDKGETGNGIISVVKTDTNGNTDTYTITFTDGTTTTFTIINGDGGQNGTDGDKGETGDKGEAGLSAYEIYIKNYPEYNKSEEEWLDDLINGRLADKVFFTVRFDSAGGTIIDNQSIEFGHKVARPTEPVREGYVFEGWYSYDEKWVFSGYVITEETVLTAKWVSKPLELLWQEKSSLFFEVWGDFTDAEEIQIADGFNGMGRKALVYRGFLLALECENDQDISDYLNTINDNTIDNVIYIRLGNTNLIIADMLFLGAILVEELVFIDNAYYNANQTILIRYNGDNSEFTIPSSVTSIGYIAFQDCSSLTSITIPNSVTNIDENAFAFCSGLTSVTFGEDSQLASIGSWAFFGCSSLTSITIPISVTTIGSYAFSGCNNLTIYARASGKPSDWDSNWSSECAVYWEITEKSFYEADGLQFVIQNNYAIVIRFTGTQSIVKIPDSITVKGTIYSVISIGYWAFNGCRSLTSITIPNRVTSIGYMAFTDCSGLTSVTFGEDSQLASIGDWAFKGCSGLTSITIPEGVTSIGSYAFFGCSSLTFIIIPNNVTIIGERAFVGCSGLTSIVIGESVTSIGESAFSACSSLTSITIPNSVTSIGNYAFTQCRNLTIYARASDKPTDWDNNWNSYGCPVVWGYIDN